MRLNRENELTSRRRSRVWKSESGIWNSDFILRRTFFGIKNFFVSKKGFLIVRTFLKFSLVFLVLSTWIFSGWPVIFQSLQIPPKVEDVNAAGWLGSWQYRKLITIDETKIDSDLTHFPVTVILDSDTDFFAALGTGDSKKVAFTESDGITQLYVEIEQFDSLTQKAAYHVSKSDWVISATTPTEFYLYYDSTQADNTTYVGDTGSAVVHNVWDSGFVGVWHKNDGVSQVITDSTSNGHNGTKKAVDNPIEADAQIGKGQDYIDDDINFGDLAIVNDFTAEAWIKADSLGVSGEQNTYGNTIMGSSILGSGYPLWISIGRGANTEVTLRAFDSDVTGFTTTNANLNTTDWFHIVAVASKGADARVYVNGVERLAFTAGTTNWSNVFVLGDLREDREIYFDGLIDEVRVSGTVRSEPWVKASYYSLDKSLLTFGLETQAGIPFSPTLYSEDGINQIAFNAIRQNSTTPSFRVSAIALDEEFDRFQLELNTEADFTGTSYVQTFSGTYASDTQYTLLANSLSPGLPTTNNATYYVRVRASADLGVNWGLWSTDNHPTWTFTYKNIDETADWFHTTNEQFEGGVLNTAETENGSVRLPNPINATGGTITEADGYIIHTFTSSGTFEITNGEGEFEYLVVGGGGGSGPRIQGGGGGGGVIQGTTTQGVGTYPVTVGAGGPRAPTTNQSSLGSNGSNSVFAGIATAIGGGRGGGVGSTAGVSGGSGGGARGNSNAVGGAGIPGQGNSGGNSASGRGGAGGGGAGGAGEDGKSPAYHGGNGGDGIASDISGVLTYYGGGGAGGAGDGQGRAFGGLGGGGDGGQTSAENGENGAPNTGGGGGGGGFTGGTNAFGGSGGSGIVIIRYPASVNEVSIMSPEIEFDWVPEQDSWGETSFSTTETNGDVKLRLYYTSTTTCDTLIPNSALSGNEEGFDVALGPIPISGLDTLTYNRICLQATLSDIGGTPYLDDWGVTWMTSSTLAVALVDEAGNAVASPTVIMSQKEFSFDDQVSTGVLGTLAQRIRTTNETSNPSWSLTIAATDGSTALWANSMETEGYDLNDPTANAEDGGDGDNYGGQMTVDASVATIIPKSGCLSTDLSLGSPASFSEGVLDSVVLLAAGTSAETGCWWDITGIDFTQTIPAAQSVDVYTVDLTLSITAQ